MFNIRIFFEKVQSDFASDDQYFPDNQLVVILIGRHLRSNRLILPTVTMNKEMQIKDEPMEKLLQIQSTQPARKLFVCYHIEVVMFFSRSSFHVSNM